MSVYVYVCIYVQLMVRTDGLWCMWPVGRVGGPATYPRTVVRPVGRVGGPATYPRTVVRPVGTVRGPTRIPNESRFRVFGHGFYFAFWVWKNEIGRRKNILQYMYVYKAAVDTDENKCNSVDIRIMVLYICSEVPM